MHGVDAKNIKIVYLVGGPLTKRWLSYYCVDEMSADFDVEFWDIAAILPDGYNVSSIEERPYARTILSLNDLRQNLKRLPKDTLLVNEIGLVPNHYEVLKLVSSYISNSIVIDFWTYFMWDVVEQLQTRPEGYSIKQRLYKNDIIWCVSKLLHCHSKADLQNLRQTLKNRKEDRQNIRELEKCRRLFNIYKITYKPYQQYTINHPDYEKYIQVRNTRERQDKYILFIADNYPYHPEIVMKSGYDKDEVAKQYYASLNRFLDKVEETYGCKVVIAEHPSSHWEHNPFNGREIIYFKTAELVRDSYAVCLHMSCAFSFVALFDKPVAILYNHALNANQSMLTLVPRMANAIQREIIDTDTIDDVNGIFQPICRLSRELYLRTFIEADSNKTNAQRLKEYFVEIHNEIIRRL